MPKLIAAVAAASMIAFAGVGHTATITGLYNTGVDDSHVALVGGNGLTELHYTIFSSTSPGFDGAAPQTYYNGAYAPNDADSRWISLTGSGTPVNNTTIYRLTFDLSGLDHTGAAISGFWGVDNQGEILLNGASTGNALVGVVIGNFSSLHAFSITSGFVAGLNTLDFVVVDNGGVTALRVDGLSGEADVAGAIPEPSTWAMLLLGFFGLGTLLRSGRRTPLNLT
jgi:hypothetical protein